MPMQNERFRLRAQMSAVENDQAEMMIYGEICQDGWKWLEEDVSALDFDKAIKKARSDGAKRLFIRINSPGGDVDQAVAMRTMLAGAGFEEVKISIEGLCASAATLIPCLPGARVTMGKGSEYMIHCPRTWAHGTAEDITRTADRLRGLEGQFAGIYAGRTGKSQDEMLAMMKEETWMGAEKAMEMGFVDEITGEEPICARASREQMALMKALYKKMPDTIREEDGSNAPTEMVGATVYNKPHNEEEKEMDGQGTNMTAPVAGSLTAQAVQQENRQVYDEILALGAQQERERLSEIDQLTPAGYEELATKAKLEGVSAYDFHKQVLAAQREKAASYAENRRQETQKTASVSAAAAPAAHGQEEGEMEKAAKEIADMAAEMRCQNEGMY